MDYSKAIKVLRLKIMLTQEELAAELGVSFETVNRWENGKCEPSMKQRRKLMSLAKENGIDLEKAGGAE